MLYRKTSHKPIPKSATVEGGVARWTGRDGKARTAPLTDDGEHISVTTGIWRARWTDGMGVVRDQSTGCRMRAAAERWLSDQQRLSELVRVGMVTPAEIAQGAAQGEALAVLVTRYIAYLDLSGRAARYRKERKAILLAVFGGCGFLTLRDLDRDRFERWLIDRRDAGIGAARRNVYRTSVVQFVNWCIRAGLLSVNPFTLVPVAPERTDRRHQRRAFTEDELRRLFEAAAARPLHDRLHKNRGEGEADLDDHTRRKMALLGRERALIYRTLFLTGLRKGELRAVRIADTDLDAGVIHLRAGDEKSRRGATIPLRPDLVEALRAHLRDRAGLEREEAMRTGNKALVRTDPARPLLEVPSALDKILKRDLTFAGIAVKDARDRVLDVHALRVSLASHLARAGVPLRTAQEIMRHSDPKLTAMIYTDPELLDTRAALDTLPNIAQGAPRDAQGAPRES